VSLPLTLYLAIGTEKPWALVALAGGPAALILRRHPAAAAAALVAGASILRVAYAGSNEGDQMELSRLALERVLAGGDPYGGYVYQSGTPYTYGPLGLLTYQLGIPAEMMATIATSAILIWARAWMTLAFFNSWPLFIYTPSVAANDYSVGFLLTLALVVLASRPRIGMTLLALAIAVKPYAAAWFLPAIGYVGFGMAAGIGIAWSVLLWSPVWALWGVGSYLESVRGVEHYRGVFRGAMASWSVDIPLLRALVIPFSLGGLVLRSWHTMAWLGTAGFLAFLGFSSWAHYAYFAAVVPLIGLTLEWRPREPQGTTEDAR
jgi:hypothetical protein